MTKRGPRHSREEFRRRGKEIYERDILPRLTPEQMGLYVAIDIESGAYEIGPDFSRVIDALYARVPDAQPWLEQAGERAATRFGYRSQTGGGA